MFSRNELKSPRRRLIAQAGILSALMIGTTGAVASEKDGKRWRVVHLPGMELAAKQSTPACPNNICPGLGNGFYLPSINALSINTGGTVFFKDRNVGDCAEVYTVTQNSRAFQVSNSMESFVTAVAIEANVSGSYKSDALSAKGTATVMAGSSSSITTTFHSTHMDITAVTNSVEFVQSSKCFSATNLDPQFLKSFEALAQIDPTKASESGQWAPYVSFLQTNGSHIMVQQQLGSRFQQWQSSTSTASGMENTLKAKACAEVEGTTETDAGWSVKGCAAYSTSEKEAALKTDTTSQSIILGGTATTRAGLTKAVTKSSLDAFIDAAPQGDQAIRFMYQPVWLLLQQIYTPECSPSNKTSVGCQNLQRAVNLQAAYEGWTAVTCASEAPGGTELQKMVALAPNSNGIRTYQCNVTKTGCRSDSDCHLGGAGSVCYCYGPGCVDTGAQINGTKFYRDTIRGSESGSYDDGVNNSCYYHFIAHCDCDTSWAGGLPNRSVWTQSTQ
ncbi:MAG: MAC/perforin domain-containing protein [Pseudomonadota bacterium]